MKVKIKSKAELEKLAIHPEFIRQFAGKSFEITRLELKGVPGWQLNGDQIEEIK